MFKDDGRECGLNHFSEGDPAELASNSNLVKEFAWDDIKADRPIADAQEHLDHLVDAVMIERR
mgnify:CR=1 FL=1